jgi:DMSO reductase family type II enzyme chaperone
MSAPQSTPIPSELDTAEHALCRSALWQALALGFRHPTGETVARLASCQGALALADAAAALDGAEGTDLAACARQLAREPVPALAALESAYGRLFGHTARGLVTPYETEYGEDSTWEPQREMSDLGAFFRAFGLGLDPEAHERPDHVACESEFLMFLARKEAHAVTLGDDAMYEETRRAGRVFLRDHLGRWALAFGAKLEREDRGGFYGALGRLCAAFAVAECGRVGVAAGPEFLRLRSATPDPAPMACGPAPACEGA